MVDLHKIARRWQRKWRTEKVFEANADDRPKFFMTIAYPYINGKPHIGHTYTYIRGEVLARYKRMRGFNVLFPQSWHATGTPIEAAARRVREKEEKQLRALKLMGFSDEDLPAFSEPIHWIKTFSKAFEQDFRDLGMSVDWRRTFITTDLDPRYSKFIKWQFRKLKKKKLIQKGSHPVVWSPKMGLPVGDHDRSEGEGEMPQEMLMILFESNGIILPCATFRPETVYGVTNIWINPNLDYVRAEVNGKEWIVTKECVEKLRLQKHDVKEVGTCKGTEFIGQKAINPVTNKELMILPASFVTPDTGTGVVMSVPAHAPFDFVALRDIQNDPAKYKVAEEVKEVKPIQVIKIEGFGACPAGEVVEKLKITSQEQKEKLDEATNEVYKKEFHTGHMIVEEFKEKSVEDAKLLVGEKLKKEKKAIVLWELMNPVISRALDRCVVRIVDDQWFLKYGDEEWKKQTTKCLEEMKLYPKKIRSQMEYGIGWIRDWACTREFGLGTGLPWDRKWKIESLSDSTIYMAYYTVAHMLKKIPLGKINEKLFDYIFYGEGDAKELNVDPKVLNALRQEFTYWYPLDVRSTAKDLVQNHLIFFLFNHVALFPEKDWPKSISVNGYVSIKKEKMSKSKGNFQTLRQVLTDYAPDVVRATILSTGEELNDVDWDPDNAQSLKNKLESWYDFVIKKYGKGDDKWTSIDSWMEHQLHNCIKNATAAMDETLFRSALMYGYFDLQRHLKWYLRRRNDRPNAKLMKDIIEAQTKLLAPFTPHLAEEIWFKIKNEALITFTDWPACDESKINPHVEESEALIQQVMDDIVHVLRLAKIEQPKNITLFVSEDWKRDLCKKLKEMITQTRNIGEIMKSVLPEFKDKGEQVAQIVQKCVKDPSKLAVQVIPQDAEVQFLEDAREFLKKQYGATIKIIAAQDTKEPKAKQAMPGKPALLVA